MKLAWLYLCASAAAGGCSQSEPAEPVDPVFEVGFTAEGEFYPLVDGAPCRVIDAPQGGYWVMPLLRIRGLGKAPTAGCSILDVDEDAVLGDAEGKRTFLDGEDGWLQHTFLLHLATITTHESYAALQGHQAQLSCTVTDGSVSLEFATEVVLQSVAPEE